MKMIARRKPDQNQAAIDPWTTVHLSAGLAMGLMNVPLRYAMTLSFAYEIAEQFFERHQVGQAFFATSGPESVPNAIVDSIALLAGHRLGQLWNRTGAPAHNADRSAA
jgi:hypothetical protein